MKAKPAIIVDIQGNPNMSITTPPTTGPTVAPTELPHPTMPVIILYVWNESRPCPFTLQNKIKTKYIYN